MNMRDPQQKVCGYEYTVRRGDSLYLIASRLGVPLRDLLDANPHINPAQLMIGDVLCIPMEEDDAPQAPSAPPADDDLDTPAVPDAPETPGQTENPPLVEPILPAPDACPEGNRYTVNSGETAADIQLRANINRYTLHSANPDADLDHLKSGDVLCVPSENRSCPAAATYRLQAEDTLESTALRLNTSLSALLRANPCLAPGDFVPGRCVWVPEV